MVFGQIKDKVGEILRMDGKCFTEARSKQDYTRWKMPGGNCSKVMKPHTQRHGQKKEIIMFRKQSIDWWVQIIGFSDLGKISGRMGDTGQSESLSPDCEATHVSYYEATGNLQKWEQGQSDPYENHIKKFPSYQKLAKLSRFQSWSRVKQLAKMRLP